MIILILQSTLSLLSNKASDLTSIDIVLRTTLSSIYGYIMSMVWSEKPKQVTENTGIKDKNSPKLKLQVLIVASVCVYCLLVLVVIRDFGEYFEFDSSDIATLTLFRDFISGGVGALIGLSRSKG